MRAIEAQLAGRTAPARTQVATRFVRRQSCGCGFGAYRRDSQPLALPQSGEPGKEAGKEQGKMGDRLAALWPVLAGMLDTAFSDGAAAATRLLDGLRAELGGQTEAFHDAVTGLLDNAGTDNERQRMLHSAICYLRDELRGWSNLQVERVLFEGLNLVALSNATSQMQHRLLLDENYLRLLGVGEQASIAFDLASLRRALVKGLPSAGVTSAYLACVAGPARGVLRSAMCLRDGELVEGDGVEYPAHQLFPPGALTDDRRETLLILPLAFENQLLGVVAFSYSDGVNAYAAFRNEIAAALKSIRLREELVQTSMRHERSVQERLSATKRMEALSVLAGGVAHDLNNALGPLVALPEVILGQLGEITGNEESVRDIRTDVEFIKVASLRAAQTIKDLLTLGRQGRTAKENLDVNRVITSCLANSKLRFIEEVGARVDLSADLHATPLVVRGSDSQLARAADNLIRNAVDAVTGSGKVVVRSARVDVVEPRAGYEIRSAGQLRDAVRVGRRLRHRAARAWSGVRALLHQEARQGYLRVGPGPRHRPWRRQGARGLHRRHQHAGRGHHDLALLPPRGGAGARGAGDHRAARERAHPHRRRRTDSAAHRTAGAGSPRVPGRDHRERQSRL